MEGVNTPGRIALIRHGQTDWNLEERLQGATDVPLNDTGRHEARAVARRLHAGASRWDVLVSSPLSRAVETAQIIGGVLGLELSETCPGLGYIARRRWRRARELPARRRLRTALRGSGWAIAQVGSGRASVRYYAVVSIVPTSPLE